MKVPISETGMVTEGTIVARQSCRKSQVIATTRMKVMTRVMTISSIVTRTKLVES